ncbi:hypothetical protein O6H91_09G107400 [Diphasiastrum complanatum]|uniref:Uncharacterized protein n=1 Tax=Diphasiastrum complanatum TaxID=34168 RepID=A0ACC2CT94_DIPCM|nr:hypothetical protein O6H91_09G107400 [Diphasiastrum complanatum]
MLEEIGPTLSSPLHPPAPMTSITGVLASVQLHNILPTRLSPPSLLKIEHLPTSGCQKYNNGKLSTDACFWMEKQLRGHKKRFNSCSFFSYSLLPSLGKSIHGYNHVTANSTT